MAGSQIGARLRSAREEATLTQKEAATRAREVARDRGVALKLHAQTLSDYERGVIAKVPIGVLESLAAVYGVPVKQLLGTVGQSTNSDETRHVIQQVQRATSRYRTRLGQQAPRDELRRLYRDLDTAVRGAVEVGNTDAESYELVVEALKELIAHTDVAATMRFTDEQPAAQQKHPAPKRR
jgi:transcriptional regulator with XRE-family HTH domain